jgi:hypothetical protein
MRIDSSQAMGAMVSSKYKLSTCEYPSSTSQALFLVTTPRSSCLLQKTHLVPTIFWLGHASKCQTSFLLKLLSSYCMTITQYGSFNVSSTLKDQEKTQKSNFHRNLQFYSDRLPPFGYHKGSCRRGGLFE